MNLTELPVTDGTVHLFDTETGARPSDAVDAAA